MITRWRARGESFEQMLARERTSLWEQPQWAFGVLVDKLAPAPPGSDWGPLPAVLRARPKSLCKDQGRSACCLPGGWPGGRQPRWVLSSMSLAPALPDSNLVPGRLSCGCMQVPLDTPPPPDVHVAPASWGERVRLQCAVGVLVDELAQAPPGADRGPLPAVLRRALKPCPCLCLTKSQPPWETPLLLCKLTGGAPRLRLEPHA